MSAMRAAHAACPQVAQGLLRAELTESFFKTLQFCSVRFLRIADISAERNIRHFGFTADHDASGRSSIMLDGGFKPILPDAALCANNCIACTS